ncbi:MAG TPA: glycosyltransferase family 25 protein [Alphaproteobacteria bacterium]|nr:glycosyltransferase family 25 protein [Alphaproteobacteria bacterium]
MKSIVINLVRAADRRVKIEAQFAAFGMPFEILEATDGKLLTNTERNLVDHNRRKAITVYPLTDNEIGCWLSHRRAMERLMESGEPMAAIIEDDAVFSPEFADVMKAIEKQADRFDFIFLHRKHKRGEIFAPCRELLPGMQLGRIGYAHMGAIAYVVSRKGAEKFLEYAPRFGHAVDKEIHRYWANGLDIYGLERPIAAQDDGGKSYIEETRMQESGNRAARAKYPDAGKLYWRLMRGLTRFRDSVHKRLIFSSYVKKGRAA